MDPFLDATDTSLREFIEIIDEADLPETRHELLDNVKNELALLRQRAEMLLVSMNATEDGVADGEDSYD